MRIRWVNQPTQFMQLESENVTVKAKGIRPQIPLHSTTCQGILEEVVFQLGLEECSLSPDRHWWMKRILGRENSLTQDIAWWKFVVPLKNEHICFQRYVCTRVSTQLVANWVFTMYQVPFLLLNTYWIFHSCLYRTCRYLLSCLLWRWSNWRHRASEWLSQSFTSDVLVPELLTTLQSSLLCTM